MDLLNFSQLAVLARLLNAEIIDLRKNQSYIKSYQECLELLIKQAQGKKIQRGLINKSIRKIYASGEKHPVMISAAYNCEYSSDNYSFLNPLLLDEGYKQIVGNLSTSVESLSVLDVGSGTCALLDFLCTKGFTKEKLSSIDISSVSHSLTLKNGYRSYLGRIETPKLDVNSYDLIFLSYFVDYDSNQKSTISESIRLLKPGGKIIFEGFLPCKSVIPKNDHFITHGNTVFEDAKLLSEAFFQYAKQHGKDVYLERFVYGHRHIHNQFGLKKRRSIYIVIGSVIP